jgi:hypothetical protein
MPIRHMIWAGLLFLAAAGWAPTPAADGDPTTSSWLAPSWWQQLRPHHARYAVIPAVCVVAGAWVWLTGSWVREPRRYAPHEMSADWEN